MKILVLNGSPKGNASVTLQTVHYLSIIHPEHEFIIENVGQRIHAIEKDVYALKKTLENADLLLFSYPVYTFIAPWQLQRFIELLKESGISVAGKYATQLSTSKHFYDVTAHRYVEDNCCDLGLRYVRGLSADMDDLTTEKGRHAAESFFDHVMYSMENGIYERHAAVNTPPKHVPVTMPEDVEEKTSGDVVILTNIEENDENLGEMIERFRAVMLRKTRVINIREYPFSGGCLGCFNCAVSGKCIWRDGFDDFLRNSIQTAEAIVFAFTIKDHSMGASFKLYDDRQFCNGHRTVTMGMPMGYLVSGNYSEEPNLAMIIEGRAQVGSNHLAGVATDEADPDREIDELALELEYALKNKYNPPQNFLGVGGMKIFRDLIWLMQGMMRADHKFYKKHGQYDFPQKQWGKMIMMYAVGALMASPKLKAKAGGKMTEGMLMPYNKVLEKTRKKMSKS